MFARGFGGSSFGRTGWFRVGQLEVTTTALLVLLGAASMLVWVVSPSSLDSLYFDPFLVRQEGELWRIVTWPIGAGLSLWGVVGLFFLWFVGHMVEDRTSRKRYVSLIALIVLVPAAIVSAIPFSVEASSGSAGMRTIGLAMLVVIAVDEPQMPGFFGIPIWVIAAVIVGVDALLYVAGRVWGGLLLFVLGLVIAVVGSAMIGAITALPGIKRLKDVPGPSSRGSRKRFGRGKGRKGGGTVTQGPWTTPSGFTPPSGGPSRLEQAELDVLLDKIGQSGIGSLSKQERDRLDELSRKMREG